MIRNLFLRHNLLRFWLTVGIWVGIAIVVTLIPINGFAHSPSIKATTTAKFTFPSVIPDANPLYVIGGGGELFTFSKTGKTTCGAYAMAESVVAPGSGPPPHIHHHANEWFYFPEGGIMLMHGSNLFPTMKDVPGVTTPKERIHLQVTPPGSIYYSSKQHLHGYVNSSNKSRKMISVWSTDEANIGISSYFSASSPQVIDPLKPPIITSQDRDSYVTQGPKYEINQSAHFWEYVDSVDYNFPKMDAHLDELQALLAPDLPGGKPRQCQNK